MKPKKHFNSLFFQISLAILIGIILLAGSLFYVNFAASERVFIETFSDSQLKIFDQVKNNFYDFYTDLTTIAVSLAKEETVIEYLSTNDMDSKDEMRRIYTMQKQAETLNIDRYADLTALIIGCNDKSYIYGKAELMRSDVEAILASDYTMNAKKNIGVLISEYIAEGFTSSTQNIPVVVFCRTIQNPQDQSILGYLYLLIREEELRQFYEGFLAAGSDIFILNQDDKVISSNNPYYFSMSEDEQKELEQIILSFRKERQSSQSINVRGENTIYLLRDFTSTNYIIGGTVTPQKAFYQSYDIRLILALTIIFTAAILISLFLTLQHRTRALYRLSNAMKHQSGDSLKRCPDLKGTSEIQNLTNTYNEMVDNLNHYILRVRETEQEKRDTELRALQMQINPHYIYNTLASIKWLIMRNDAEIAIQALDAFIDLLRSSISDREAEITVRQEITNLKNYVLINRIRYGDRIKVEFFTSDYCQDLMLPKMILQPLVENAFFHAFPNERSGNIGIFIQQLNEKLQIEIIDDGIGMMPERLQNMQNEPEQKGHFTGVGVKNVDERLKLLYGTEYGVQIDSREMEGTTVIINIPVRSISTE